MVPTNTKVYINTRSSHFSQAIEISQISQASSRGLLGVSLRYSEPSSIPGDSGERFSVSRVEFLLKTESGYLRDAEVT